MNEKTKISFLQEYRVPIPWLRILCSFVALITLLILILINMTDMSIKILLFLFGAIIGGWFFIYESLEALIKKQRITIDVLMTLAILGAGLLNQYTEGMIIVFLYSITEILESFTMTRTRTAIKSLIKFVPHTTHVIVNSTEDVKAVEELKINDVVQLRPGDYCPSDGIIISGSSFMNEALITGESIPVNKIMGDPVFAGSICHDGFIQIKITRPVSESTVARIISMVEEAQKKKMPIQQLIEKFTKLYNPLIIVFAFFIIIIPSILFGETEHWAILGTTFLVAAAPCALAIATPVTIFAGVGTAGKKGILVKGGAYLERLGEIQGIAFDKTGTLTFGEFILTDIIVVKKEFSRDDALQRAASLEFASNHPLAKAVLEASKTNKCDLLDGQNIQTLPGKGITGIIGGDKWFFGSPDLQYCNIEELKILQEFQDEGKSVAVLLLDKELMAIFAFEDQIRPETKLILDNFQQKKISVFMLTGDHQKAALQVANQLGLEERNVFAELTPEMKSHVITDLKTRMKLAMVGDGINDAPALAIADLGIAMGTVGTDVALETADIAILGDSLVGLKAGITIGQKMRNIVRQNLVVSVFIIGAVLTGVLIGIVNLSLAILVHEGSEVLIVGNSLRLLAKI